MMISKTVAFIVARLSSSRFPKKHFRKIGSLSLLDWILYNLKQSKEIDQIVLATVAEDENKPLIKWCEEKNISYFWYNGDVNHVTTRLVKAAQEYKADICILISGDCPLVDAKSIDIMIKELKKHPDRDYILISNKHNLYPAIQGIQVAWRKTWELADQLSNTPQLKEHHFPILSIRKDLFKPHKIVLTQDIYAPFNHRLSIDTWADLKFFNKVYSRLTIQNKDFTLPNVINILVNEPELLDINKHVHQRQLDDKIKNILMIVDSGLQVGYGHLMRSVELGLKITEFLSWPVTFLLQDKTAINIVNQYGIKTIYHKNAIDDLINNIDNKFNFIDLNKFNIIIFDLFHNRNIDINWLNNNFNDNQKLIVLDNLDSWCLKADKIIIPGVTVDTKYLDEGLHNLVWGKDYIIIRQDILNQLNKCQKKEIDFLIYLHNIKLQQEIKRILSKKFKVISIEHFSPDFAQLLACSKMFISSFGYSFYEAIFLKTYPICLPDSSKHERDALIFYKNFGLKPQIIHKVDEFRNFKEALSFPKEISIKDGVKNIVNEIKNI